jgi:hypothetical protein
MARNDVVLIDSLVKKATPSLGENRSESEIFELFCFDNVLKDSELSYEELESGWTDGPDDGGIDGFFVFVDGNLATEAQLESAARRNPEIRVVLITVKRSDTFDQQPLNALCSSIPDLFDLTKSEDGLGYPFRDAVVAQRELFRSLFISLADRHPRLVISLYYCCRGDTSNLSDNLTSRATQLEQIVRGLFGEVACSVQFLGATEMLELARHQRAYSLRLRFIETYISREGRNYVVLCPLRSYFDFVTDEQGKLRRYLFESNVRDYLGEVLINRDIRGTLERKVTAADEDFWWLNNGVTILATHATVVGKDLAIENVQIVNGLQTTETIYQHFSQTAPGPDDRAILIKILLTADEGTRSRIVKATNYQNTVDLSSLRGLDKIQQDIEHFLLDHGWCYDRRKNFYKNQGKPADRIVSMPYLAAAVRAVALGDPAASPRQRSRSLRDDEVYKQVFNQRWDLRVYLASLEITRAVETVLQGRRMLTNTPPIALVHYVAYIYVCSKLGKHQYRPDEVAAVAGFPPEPEEVLRIREELSAIPGAKEREGRFYQGVKLNKGLIEDFARGRYKTSIWVSPAPPAETATLANGRGDTAPRLEPVTDPPADVKESLVSARAAETGSSRVLAGYMALHYAAAAVTPTSIAGERIYFKQSLREAAGARGTVEKKFEKDLYFIFMLRGRVLHGYEPTAHEAEAYLAAVERLLSCIGFKIAGEPSLPKKTVPPDGG